MLIRNARAEDIARIVQFQIAMALETEELTLEFATVTKGVSSVISDPSKGKYFVAEERDEVVAVFLTMPEWSDWRNGTVLWLHSLYVLPEFRGQGIYKRMYEHLRGLVESTPDYRGIRLYVDKRNVSAQRVYQKLGMTAEHYDLYEWLKG